MSLYDDASLIMFPSGYKEDKIYSLKPTDGSGDLTFTRASTATRVNADGLIEGVRTNLQIYSEDFRNIAEGGATNTWTPNDTVILSTNNEAPDGTLTATRIRGTSGGNKARQAVIFGTSGLSYTGSFFIRRLSGTGTIQLRVGDVGTTSTINPTSTWQRFDHTVSPTTTTIRLALVLSNDTDEFEIWGAQLEVSDFGATEYIPTTTTAVSVGMLADVPRIDYTGGGCGKLLLEPQRTNLVTYSEQFDNAAWIKNVTVSANLTISPDGTQNADKILESASNVPQWAYQSFSMTGAQTATIYAKKGERNYIALATAGLDFSYFNLDTGVVVSTASGATTSIQNAGNGWYRCSVNASTPTSTFFIVAISDNGTRIDYAGDVTKGIYVWAGQNESGSYATSYIPTLASSVTRLADAASKTGISSLINSVEGVLYLEIAPTKSTTNQNFITLNDGSSNNKVSIRFDYADNKVVFFYTLAGVSQGVQSLSDWDFSITNKLAFLYQNSNFKSYRNGVQITTSVSGSTAIANTLNKISLDIGNGTSPFNGEIKSLIIFPSVLSDTELATLTTL